MSNATAENLVMELLDSPPPPRGRRARPTLGAITRELTSEDIQRLHTMKDGDLKSQPRPLLKLRHTHHTLAKLLADGEREEACQAITGYSQSYVSTVKKDPAFKNLVEYYQSQKKEVYLDVHQRLASLSMDTVEELQDRLLTDPESFSNRELMELGELVLDRSGAGPTSTVKGVVALLTSDDIQRIRDEASRRQNGSIRSLNPQDNSRPPMGGTLLELPLAEGQAERQSSQRDNLPEPPRAKTTEPVR